MNNWLIITVFSFSIIMHILSIVSILDLIEKLEKETDLKEKYLDAYSNAITEIMRLEHDKSFSIKEPERK